MNETDRAGVDVVSAVVLLSALAGWLPPLASLLTIVWLVIRIWETPTVKGWTGRRDNKNGDPQDGGD